MRAYRAGVDGGRGGPRDSRVLTSENAPFSHPRGEITGPIPQPRALTRLAATNSCNRCSFGCHCPRWGSLSLTISESSCEAAISNLRERPRLYWRPAF